MTGRQAHLSPTLAIHYNENTPKPSRVGSLTVPGVQVFTLFPCGFFPSVPALLDRGVQFGFSKKLRRQAPRYFATGDKKMTTKKHTATLLILMLVGLTGLVHAQMDTKIKAQVPFNFVANGKTMPAGECTIQIKVNGLTTLSISSGKQHAFAFPIAKESSNGSKKTALVFHRYGDRYFLARIKDAGRTGYDLPASKLESELRAGNVPEEVLTLLASVE